MNTVYNFVEKPTQEFFCPLTSVLLREPRQTNFCCGHHLSRAAAEKLEAAGKPCPFCKKTPLKTTEDLFFRRKVMQLGVRCSNKSQGCDWEGTLGDLDRHLQCGSQAGECRFISVQCPFNCGGCVLRGNLGKHKTSECGKRPSVCEHCQYRGTYEVVAQDHARVCPKYPIECPKKCSDAKIQRFRLNAHLLQECPKREVECEYSYAGCTAKVEAAKMKEHMETRVEEHLRMLAGYTKTLHTKVDALQVQVQKLLEKDPKSVCIPAVEFTMRNFRQKRKANAVWYSPSFYTFANGYKMCLRVHANGNGTSMGHSMGVFLNMMSGEFDDQLRWPFKGEITIELVNQSVKGENWRRTITQADLLMSNRAFHRVSVGDRADKGWGFAKFILHNNLHTPAEGKDFLVNDTVNFRVTKCVVSLE